MSDTILEPSAFTPAEDRAAGLQRHRGNGDVDPSSSVDDQISGILRNAQHSIRHGYEECEERVRRAPGTSLLSAFACGYLLRSLPVEAILAAQVRLLLSLARPALFLYGTAKVYEYLIGRATPRQ